VVLMQGEGEDEYGVRGGGGGLGCEGGGLGGCLWDGREWGVGDGRWEMGDGR